jgi:hypothetical protein
MTSSKQTQIHLNKIVDLIAQFNKGELIVYLETNFQDFDINSDFECGRDPLTRRPFITNLGKSLSSFLGTEINYYQLSPDTNSAHLLSHISIHKILEFAEIFKGYGLTFDFGKVNVWKNVWRQ